MVYMEDCLQKRLDSNLRENEKFPLETIVGLVLELTLKVLFSLDKYLFINIG